MSSTNRLFQRSSPPNTNPSIPSIPSIDKDKLESKRTSTGDWLDLEGALFEWQQRMQKNKAVITGEILKNQAGKLWDSLPQGET
jgi:hypothetical protein